MSLQSNRIEGAKAGMKRGTPLSVPLVAHPRHALAL